MRNFTRIYADPGLMSLFPPEVAVETAAADGRRDFRAGRACARRALLRLGGPDGPIPIGADREPVWPEGFVGGIAHAEGLACAAVARAGAIHGLGIDVEPLAPLDLAVEKLVCSGAELAAFEGQPHGPLLVFCAKEAFYKAQFPLTRAFLDFADVQVRAADEPGAFTAGSPRAPFKGEGRWAIDGGFLFAGVVLRR